MEKITLISGLPRAGSTILSNIINSNPNHLVTPTSGVIDVLKNIRSTISNNPSFKAQNRLQLMENIRLGLLGFLQGYFYNNNCIFDKCRGWTNNLALLDAILGHQETKIIFTYRNPVEVVGSIEARYQKTILLENADEQHSPGAFATLDRRIGTLINEGGLVSYPVEILKDAIESGYLNRILFVKYYDLTTDTQNTMDMIHDFIGEPRYPYDLKNIKQSTFENDGVYNYKFMHTIREGAIEYKQADIILPQKYIQIINDRFSALNKLVFNGDPSDLLGITIMPNQEQQIAEQTQQPQPEENKPNPFKIG